MTLSSFFTLTFRLSRQQHLCYSGYSKIVYRHQALSLLERVEASIATTFSRMNRSIAFILARDVGVRRTAVIETSYRWRLPPVLLSLSQSRNFSIKNSLYPYSGSLPSPGHEWCTRCNIPSKALEKAIGQHNPCLDRQQQRQRPTRLFWFGYYWGGLCAPARNYYRQQLTTMGFLTLLCFVALPGVTLGESVVEE